MGVVHKLTDEVIEFIIKYKKTNPKIGCRDLAKITSQKFQTDVSKSSVNTVLKDSKLSNPLGRPFQSTASKIFKIPEERKKQLFKETTPKIAKPSLLPAKEINKKSYSENIDHKQKMGEKQPSLGKAHPFKDDYEALPLIQDPLSSDHLNPLITESTDDFNKIETTDYQQEDLLKTVHQLRQQVLSSRTDLHQGTGEIFLRMIFDDFFRQFKLTELLNKYVQNRLPADFENLCETAFVQYVSQRFGFAADNASLSLSIDTHTRIKVIYDIVLPSIFGLEYSLLKNNSLKTISFLRILLKDKTEIIADPHLAFVWDDRLRLERPRLFYATVETISQCLIGNVEPAVLNLSQNIYETPKALAYIVASFYNMEQKSIKKIILVDDMAIPVTDFDIIPQIKRNFLIGLSARQKEFAEITQHIKWGKKEAFYHESTNQFFYFTDTKTDFLKDILPQDQSLRVLSLFDENKKEAIFCILTNMEKKSSRDLVDQFLDRWPDPVNPFIFMPTQKEDNKHSEIKNNHFNQTQQIIFGDILNDYFKCLWEYMFKFYIPKVKVDGHVLLKEFMKIPGATLKTSQGFILELKLSAQFPFWDELNFFVQRINENNIKRASKKGLYIKFT